MIQFLRIFSVLFLVSVPFGFTKAEDHSVPQKFTLSNTKKIELRGPSPRTIPFAEKFTYGEPVDWTIIDANRDNKYWRFQPEIGGRYEMYGEGFGYAYIEYEVPTRSNDWLVTPQIVIPSELAFVNFSFHLTAFSDVYFKVSISETTMDTVNFKQIGYFDEKLPYEGDTLKGRPSEPVSLDDYIGKNIYVAFADQSAKTKRIELTDIILYGLYVNPTPTGIASTESMLIPFISVQNKSIYFNNVSGYSEVGIWDVSGKQLDSFTIKGSGESRPLGRSGVYLVKLKNNKQTFSYKVIVH